MLVAVAAVLWAVTLVGGAPQAGAKIEPKAAKNLKAMSSYLAGLKTFSFQVEEFFDVVQDDGQKRLVEFDSAVVAVLDEA